MHDNVNQHHAYDSKGHKFQVVRPAVTIRMNCLLHCLFSLLYQSLAASNCCLVPAWRAFHLLALYQWGHDLFWFHWSLSFCLWAGLFLRPLGLLLNRFLVHLFFGLFNLLFFVWRFFGNSDSALASRFLDYSLLNRLRGFLLNSRRFLLLNGGFGFRRWWSDFFNRRSSFLYWGFSLSHRRLQGSFVLEAFDNFLKCKSGLFKIYFKFDSVLIWDLNFFFKPVLSLFLELSNVCRWIDINTSKIIFLIGLFLIELEGEGGFSIGIEIGYVEIQLAASEGHDVGTIGIDKIGISHDFVFVELLHTCIN